MDEVDKALEALKVHIKKEIVDNYFADRVYLEEDTEILHQEAQAYRQEYGLNAIVLLPVNLYGPRDNFDLETSHVIPAMIRKCLEAQDRGDDLAEPAEQRLAERHP